jgi:hypothetical protein
LPALAPSLQLRSKFGKNTVLSLSALHFPQFAKTSAQPFFRLKFKINPHSLGLLHSLFFSLTLFANNLLGVAQRRFAGANPATPGTRANPHLFNNGNLH